MGQPNPDPKCHSTGNTSHQALAPIASGPPPQVHCIAVNESAEEIIPSCREGRPTRRFQSISLEGCFWPTFGLPTIREPAFDQRKPVFLHFRMGELITPSVTY